MNIKLQFFKLSSFVLAFFFLVSIQNSVDAQITVFNATGCTITVFVGQEDMSTAIPCDLCPINPPSAVVIGPFSTVPIFGQDVCGEQFAWVAWTISITGGFGISANPGLLAACVPTVSGPVCTAATNAFWFGGGGTGPVAVAIF